MLTYQTVLLEQDDVELKVTNLELKLTNLNPALFLTANPLWKELAHDCLQSTEQVYYCWEDIKNLKDMDWELLVDGSSFVKNITRKAKLLSRNSAWGNRSQS